MKAEDILKQMPRAKCPTTKHRTPMKDAWQTAFNFGKNKQALLCAQWIAENFVELPSEDEIGKSLAYIYESYEFPSKLFAQELWRRLRERDWGT